MIALGIDSVWDDGVCLLLEKAVGGVASGYNAVHLAHEPAGKFTVIALGGRGESDFELGSKDPFR